MQFNNICLIFFTNVLLHCSINLTFGLSLRALFSQRQRLESGVGLTSGLTQTEERHHNLMKHLHPSAMMAQLYHDLPGNYQGFCVLVLL